MGYNKKEIKIISSADGLKKSPFKKGKLKKFTSNPDAGVNKLMLPNPNYHTARGKLFLPHKQDGGWLDKYQDGGNINNNENIITDPRGQWAHPGEITKIPSGNITMQGVPYPVLGVDNLGNQQLMYPGLDYTFPGQSVTEYPQISIAKHGGSLNSWLDKYQNGGNLPSETVNQQSIIDPYLKAEQINKGNQLQNEEKKKLALEYYNKRKNQRMIGQKGTPDQLDIINKDISQYSANNAIDYKYTPIGQKVEDFAVDFGLNMLGTGLYSGLNKSVSNIGKPLLRTDQIINESIIAKQKANTLNELKNKFIYPNKSTGLSKNMEPYISKRIIKETPQEEVYNSFLSPEMQQKKIAERTINYDKNGNIIKKLGGQSNWLDNYK